MKTPQTPRLVQMVLLLAVGLGTPARAEEAAARKPNILFILTDDQRYDALGVVQREQGAAARFPWLRTPNLDQLAADGMRFRNAFVVNSLCSPSRASFLTGKHGHENGVTNNHTSFPEQSVTIASLLHQAGYATGYVGKWHMGTQRGQRPGFDYSASFVGQRQYFDCPFEVNGSPTPTTGWVDDVSTAYAESFLREKKDQPFALVIGFKTCHGPFQPPPRQSQTYASDLAGATPNLKIPAIYASGEPPKMRKIPASEPDAAGRVATNLGYFRTITAVDENIGKIMKLLAELNLADNTVVVFAGDNGYYLGEHELGDKRTGYEESMRIPLIVRYPTAVTKGQVTDKMALNIDLAPTLLDFAGVAVPAEMRGRSWRPVLAGKPADDWRRSFFYNYFYERSSNAPAVTAVRTETAKLIKYPGHDEWTEYFDLKSDPFETRNLANDPNAAALRAELNAEFAKQSAAIAFTVPASVDKPSDRVNKAERKARRAKAAANQPAPPNDPAEKDE